MDGRNFAGAYLFSICIIEKSTKINKKRPGLVHFLQKVPAAQNVKIEQYNLQQLVGTM